MDLLAPLQALSRRTPQAPTVVAVSGGRDSMALGHACAQVFPKPRLTIAHFNHGLRGAESDADETLVRDTFSALGVNVVVERGTGEARSEGDLREARRAFLEKVAGAEGIILTAHHAEDQLETFFLRLLRGAGGDGLSGMRETHGRYVKPWLGVPREAIEGYVTSAAVPFRDDATNALPLYLRNRVRHELLPKFFELTGDFGGEPATRERLLSLMNDLREDGDFLDREIATRFGAKVIETPFWFRVPRDAIFTLESPLKERAIRHMVRRLGMDAISRDETKRLLTDLQKGRRDIPVSGGGRVLLSCAQFFFQSPAQRAKAEAPPLVVCKGDTWAAPDLGLELGVAALPPDTELRFFQEGDRQNGKKLKQLWLEERVPAAERRLVPLLARRASNEIIWRFPEKHAALRLKSVSFPFSFLA